MEIILAVISWLLISTVVISMIHKSYWIFRVFEYPRLQKLIIMSVLLLLWGILKPFDHAFYSITFAVLCLCTVYLVVKVSPYTFLNRKEMKRVNSDSAHSLSIFTANVYQHNKDYDRLLAQIEACDPDIIFLVETDQGWMDAVEHLSSRYPFMTAEPRSNTYGLIFFSRLNTPRLSIQHLVKAEIPSLDAVVELPSGVQVQLYGLHPEPPVPGENRFATAKDKELMKIAFAVRNSRLPCVVYGDLNDVAWSHTTELFRKTSELLDPRRGRGFYSTFSARHWYMRFPLDYIFCSQAFGLVTMKRLPYNGSDHFAVFTEIVYAPAQLDQKKPRADAEDIQSASETLQKPVES